MATSVDPVLYDLVHEVKTKNIPKKQAIHCKLVWKEDHPDWVNEVASSNSVLDPHGIYPTRFEADGLTNGTAKSDVDHALSWEPAALANTNEMEIFAVIRAEYRFVGDNGWTKRLSKKGSQGIDNLFSKTAGASTYWAVVESKCTTSVADYTKYQNGSSPLGKLGKPNPKIKYKGKTVPVSSNGVRQMSEPWIYHAFLQEAAGTPNPEVIDNLKDWWEDLGTGEEPFKWLNVYGTDAFHLIPGVYESSALIPSAAKSLKLDDIQIEWPDDHYREYEFFSLDDNTNTYAPAQVKGKWWDIAAAFDALCAKHKVDKKKLDAQMELVDKEFS